MSLHRFGRVICEVEDIEDLCPNCGIPLIEWKESTEQEVIGRNAKLPLYYCEKCEEFFLRFRQGRTDKNGEEHGSKNGA